MKFILDENTSVRVEKSLHSLGHITLRLPRGTSDIDIIVAAGREKAAILSHDKDFLSLPPADTKGIIVLRIHPPRPDEIISSIREFLARVKASEWEGKIVLLEKEGFHIRF